VRECASSPAAEQEQHEEPRKEQPSLCMLLFVSCLTSFAYAPAKPKARCRDAHTSSLEELSFVRCPRILSRPAMISVGGDPQDQGQQNPQREERMKHRVGYSKQPEQNRDKQQTKGETLNQRRSSDAPPGFSRGKQSRRIVRYNDLGLLCRRHNGSHRCRRSDGRMGRWVSLERPWREARGGRRLTRLGQRQSEALDAVKALRWLLRQRGEHHTEEGACESAGEEEGEKVVVGLRHAERSEASLRMTRPSPGASRHPLPAARVEGSRGEVPEGRMRGA